MIEHEQGKLPIEDSSTVADERLLERFCISQDEQAFRTLVERYSRMVLGVCTRVLHNAHDAEEAFQATFMVLAAKAPTLRADCSLAAWLYRVGHHTAIRAAQKRSRRRCESLAEDVSMIDDVLENVTDAYRQQVLDEELNGLAKKYREPLVLHYLLGKTNKQIAATLKISERTVEGRQRQGKRLLRRRLVLRKVSLPLALAAIATSGRIASAASLEPLIETTVQASLAFAANPVATASTLPSSHLAQKEILAMSQFSTSVASIVAAVALVCVAIGLAVAESPGQSDVTLASPVPPQTAEVAADDPILDTKVILVSSQKTTSKPKLAASKPSDIIPQSFTFKTKSKARQYIERALESNLQVPLEAVDEPLIDVINLLAEDFNIPILFDNGALDELGISPETEVSINLRKVKLRSALKFLFKQPGVEDLTYIIQDEVLLITTQDRANESLETLVYDLRTLPGSETIGEVIQATIARDSWMIYKTGEGDLQTLAPGVLVIAQTHRVHRKIDELLVQIARIQKPKESQPEGQLNPKERN